MSLEARILEVQNALNNKQVRSGQLTIDRLVVHQPINIGSLSLDNLTVANLHVSNRLTANELMSNGSVIFNGSVIMNSSVSMNGSTNVSNIQLRELRDVTIKGWLNVESSISAGGEIRGSVVRNAVWN